MSRQFPIAFTNIIVSIYGNYTFICLAHTVSFIVYNSVKVTVQVELV